MGTSSSKGDCHSMYQTRMCSCPITIVVMQDMKSFQPLLIVSQMPTLNTFFLSFEIQPLSTSPNLFPSMLLHKWSRSSTYFQSHLTQSQVKLVRWWVVRLDKCLQIPKPSFHLSKQTTHHLTRWVFFSSKLTFNWTFPQLNPKLTQT